MRIANHVAMGQVMETMLALQNLELRSRDPAPEVKRQTEALRQKIPESLLTQFDRWLARRRKAVAVVHHGVCGECHIRLAVGVVGALAFGEEIQRCGNCGRFLYLPEDEPAYSATPAATAKPTRRAKGASTRVQ
jgi:predicted  nucleic acid-binding Zn-ribbon protein